MISTVLLNRPVVRASQLNMLMGSPEEGVLNCSNIYS